MRLISSLVLATIAVAQANAATMNAIVAHVTTIVSRLDPAQLEKFGIRGTSIWSHPDGNELAGITKLIEAGKIKPVVGQVMPLTEAVIASQQAETHHTRGKIVLKIAEEPK